jgi:hypothetical protein
VAFPSHTEFARIRILLEIKGLWFEQNTAAPGIFSFETNDYRGFEFKGAEGDRVRWRRNRLGTGGRGV